MYKDIYIIVIEANGYQAKPVQRHLLTSLLIQSFEHFFIAFTESCIQRTLMVTQGSMFSIFGRSILSEARIRD